MGPTCYFLEDRKGCGHIAIGDFCVEEVWRCEGSVEPPLRTAAVLIQDVKDDRDVVLGDADEGEEQKELDVRDTA